jgi:hypothetical protein
MKQNKFEYIYLNKATKRFEEEKKAKLFQEGLIE